MKWIKADIDPEIRKRIRSYIFTYVSPDTPVRVYYGDYSPIEEKWAITVFYGTVQKLFDTEQAMLDYAKEQNYTWQTIYQPNELHKMDDAQILELLKETE